MEGMAFRLVPEKRKANSEFIEPNILKANLTEAIGYSKDYQPGFKFRGLNDPTIFFDDNHKRMVQNYRNAFLRLSIYYLGAGQKDLAVKTLDDMETKLPRKLMPIDYWILYSIGDFYSQAGARDKFLKIAGEVEKDAVIDFEKNLGNAQNMMTPFRVLTDIYEQQGKNDKLLELWLKLETMYPQDPNVQASVNKYRNLVQGKVDTSKIK
jgi:tetratricopeptide (TPR) repeat protein